MEESPRSNSEGGNNKSGHTDASDADFEEILSARSAEKFTEKRDNILLSTINSRLEKENDFSPAEKRAIRRLGNYLQELFHDAPDDLKDKILSILLWKTCSTEGLQRMLEPTTNISD